MKIGKVFAGVGSGIEIDVDFGFSESPHIEFFARLNVNLIADRARVHFESLHFTLSRQDKIS